MRYLIFILLTTIFSFSALAEEESITPEMRNLEINLMNENLSPLGLYEYLDTSTVPEGLLDFDQAYVTADTEEFVLVKFAGPVNESRFEKITADEGTILNFTTRWGNLVSIYIDTTDENKIADIQSALGISKTSLWQLIVPSAQAALPCKLAKKEEGAGYQSLVRSCVGTALSSLKNSVKSSAQSIWSAVKSLKNIRYFWSEAKKQFQALKKAISEITKTVPEFIAALRGLKPSVRMDVVCSWIGTMAPDILLSLTGAGIGKLSAKILSGIKKIKGLNKTIKSFQRMDHVIPAKAQSTILSGAISCGI